MTFQSCDECGGQCCRTFGVPAIYRDAVHTTGVPLAVYQGPNDANPARYFALHFGVSIQNGGERGPCVVVAPNIPVVRVAAPDRFLWLVQSVCRKLGVDGRCTIYDARPDMCRNFTETNMKGYYVPDGCKYTANAAEVPE